MINMKSILPVTLRTLLALSMAVMLSTSVLAADSYPSKPVRFIVPFAPGGVNDIVARMIATKLTERLGKPVIVDNRSGGGGIVGTEVVAKANPDGYTLLQAGGPHTVQPAYQQLPYDALKSFTPVVKVGSGPYTFVVHPGVPAHSVKEFIALAKQKPGQLIVAAAGSGSPPHLFAELFKIMADIDFKIVHFKGGGPMVTDLLGGHSHAIIGTTQSLLSHIKSGQLRVLGTGGLKRSIALPDVPTIAEAGIPEYEAVSWWGILGPAGMPAAIVDRWNSEIKAILAMDEVKKWFLNQGVELGYTGPAEFEKFLRDDIAKWTLVIKKANIKME